MVVPIFSLSKNVFFLSKDKPRHLRRICVKTLPNDNNLGAIKSKAFADDLLNIAKLKISLYDRVENTGRKGENACHPYFLLFSVLSKVGVFW